MRLTNEELGELTQTISNTVRNARKTLHATQDAVVEKTGLSKTYLSYVETGSRVPSLEVLYLLAKAFGCTLHIEFRSSDNVVHSGALER